MVCFYKGSQIGIKGGKRLSACPLVLHDSQKIYHLVAQNGQMLCRSRGDLSRNPPQSLHQKLL